MLMRRGCLWKLELWAADLYDLDENTLYVSSMVWLALLLIAIFAGHALSKGFCTVSYSLHMGITTDGAKGGVVAVFSIFTLGIFTRWC